MAKAPKISGAMDLAACSYNPRVRRDGWVRWLVLRGSMCEWVRAFSITHDISPSLVPLGWHFISTRHPHFIGIQVYEGDHDIS